MNKPLVTTLISFVLVLPAHAQAPSSTAAPASPAPSTTATVVATSIDPQKEALIRELLGKTKETEMAVQRIMQGLTAMKQVMPRVPEKYWTSYAEEIKADELRNHLVHVYDKYFTTEELKALLQFYETTVGKKLTEVALPILQESMAIAQEQARRAAQTVGKDFRTEQLLQRPRAAGSLALPPIAPNPPPTPTPAVTGSP